MLGIVPELLRAQRGFGWPPLLILSHPLSSMLFPSAGTYSLCYLLRVHVVECNNGPHFMFFCFSLKRDEFSLTTCPYKNNGEDWIFDGFGTARE